MFYWIPEKVAIFQGTVVSKSDEYITIDLNPGVQVEVKTSDVEELEEATDEATRRTYVRVKLNPDADFTANFQPKLARLASAVQGVPFGFGGIVPQNGTRPVLRAQKVNPIDDPGMVGVGTAGYGGEGGGYTGVSAEGAGYTGWAPWPPSQTTTDQTTTDQGHAVDTLGMAEVKSFNRGGPFGQNVYTGPDTITTHRMDWEGPSRPAGIPY